MDPKDVAENKVVAAMSYLSILILVPVFVGRHSPFVRYHLNQGLALWCLGLATLPLACVNFVIALVPFIGFIVSLLFGVSVFFVFMGLVAFGVYNVSEGRCVPLPIIGTALTLIETQPPVAAAPPRLPPQ